MRLPLGRLAVLMCTSVLAATGCGAGDHASKSPEPNGPSEVYPVRTPGNDRVATALRVESARRGTPQDLCTVQDGADGEELLAITVAWTPQSLPSGRSVRHTATVGPEDAGRLLVACDIGGGGGTEPGGARSLEFAMRDHFTVSDHSHAKLLIASAKGITSRLDCRGAPAYPDPKDVAPPPDPGLR
ncbi:hypothetical protein [Streptomyces antioxidans]|uniref:hypothetical protein n=1 Tax=Streptomyces TaxID=1883 RepID=UPI00117E035B|nr:hypothetical protein [Streptomyces antioxidans]